MLKTCTKCSVERPLSDFGRRAKARDGLNPHCKPCCRAYYAASANRLIPKMREYYAANRARLLEQKAEYQARAGNRIRASKAARYRTNPEPVRAKRNAYHAANKTEVNARRTAAYAATREAAQARSRAYYSQNRERIRERTTALRRDPKRRLDAAIRSGVWRGLVAGAKRRRRTFELLGYSALDLMAHLERQFLPGMVWANYGEWHVDHIVPLAAFNYQTPDDFDFRRAWALSNLRPLWAADNQKKRARLLREFQPSLLIARAG